MLIATVSLLQVVSRAKPYNPNFSWSGITAAGEVAKEAVRGMEACNTKAKH